VGDSRCIEGIILSRLTYLGSYVKFLLLYLYTKSAKAYLMVVSNQFLEFASPRDFAY
jgi:hypothetical protein